MTDDQDMNFRARVELIIFGTGTPAGRAFDVLLLVAIMVSVGVVMIDSVSSYHLAYGDALYKIEVMFTLLFTAEYLIRIWCVRDRLVYITSFWGIVDLLAILPTYIALLLPSATPLLTIRLLRMLRVFRVLRLFVLFDEFLDILKVLRSTLHSIIVFATVVLIVIVIFGCLMYVLEGPEHGFTSIPMSMYWAMVTIAHVARGDGPARLGQLRRVIIVTGDAYVDHASFGMALIGRLLEAQGFRVGIIAQPDWTSAEAFRALGRPNLCSSASAPATWTRWSTATPPTGCRAPTTPTRRAAPAGGGRTARCWSMPARPRGLQGRAGDPARRHRGQPAPGRPLRLLVRQVRRSVLVDSKADLLLYGNAERAICEIAHRLARGEPIGQHPRHPRHRPSCVRPADWTASTRPLWTTRASSRHAPRSGRAVDDAERALQRARRRCPSRATHRARLAGSGSLRLPSFEQVRDDPLLYAHAAAGAAPGDQPRQRPRPGAGHGDRDLWLNPPPIPLTTPRWTASTSCPTAAARTPATATPASRPGR
jgi:hypothetical protein